LGNGGASFVLKRLDEGHCVNSKTERDRYLYHSESSSIFGAAI
jgi:hypothetical protein